MASTKRDYYEVLAIDRNADVDEVKRAYRKLAIKYHPDKNPGDNESEELFKEATEAYKALSDSEQRRIYDTYGHKGLEGSGFQGFSSVDEIFQSFDIFGSVLGDLFGFGGGGGRGRNRPRKGRNVRVRVPLTFLEAFEGAEKEMALADVLECEDCRGSGAGPEGLQQCKECGGSGQVVSRSGFFTMAVPCRSCNGRGAIISSPCEKCSGEGRVQQRRGISVTIPAGVDSGDSMGVPGEGEPGASGGPRGDLILVFDVATDERFQRDGADLHLQVPVSFFQAALGDKLEVESVDGPLQVKVDAGTQPGDSVRVKRRGMTDPNSGRRGDLYVHLQVKVPRKLSRNQRKTLEEAAGLFEEDSSEKKDGGWF